ncbi:hypothetical protein KKC22_08040, partial [Myxococcota bacterium]|nr:hypothetical protein [Myxococcota bacterium]
MAAVYIVDRRRKKNERNWMPSYYSVADMLKNAEWKKKHLVLDGEWELPELEDGPAPRDEEHLEMLQQIGILSDSTEITDEVLTRAAQAVDWLKGRNSSQLNFQSNFDITA